MPGARTKSPPVRDPEPSAALWFCSPQMETRSAGWHPLKEWFNYAARWGLRPALIQKMPSMPDYPSPQSWEYATERQRARGERSFRALAEKAVPVYAGPLVVADDLEANLQTARDVAQRLLVLWAVELRAEGVPQAEVLGIIDNQQLWPAVSPAERKFLADQQPDPDQCQRLVWRLESIWVLLWALGYAEGLDWPSHMCDVPRLAKMVMAFEGDSEFIAAARLRSTAEILDAQDLIMRIHWAIRDAYLHHGSLIPDGLDWSAQGGLVPVQSSPAVGVVQQRHYAFNWVANVMNSPDWDNVDTST